jgi:hypothetical protein
VKERERGEMEREGGEREERNRERWRNIVRD